MSFIENEQSLISGEPYELHEFHLGDSSTYWRYADAPANIDYGGNTFIKNWMIGGTIERGVTAIKSRTLVKCDWTNPFVWQYTISPPESIVHYTRYKGHGSNVATIFKGDVADVIFRQASRKGDRYAEIIIDPATAVMEQMGLGERYSRTCRVALYSDRCGVNPDSFKESGSLTGVSNNILTSTTFGGQSDGWWIGGKVMVNNQNRKVIAHTGNNITIWPMIYGLAGTESFDVWPGCDHLYATCKNKFSNAVNCKCMQYIPDENPVSQWGF